ncbi:MAG: hypothetical protein R3B06_15370 [Kofleriaceae bacterium]
MTPGPVARRLAATLAIAGAACGGATSAAPSTTPPAGASAAPTSAPSGLGTAGLPGLDWGASADAVRARYPMATPDATGVVVVGMTEGHQALTRFTIDAQGLRQVDVEWIEGFISMQDCADGNGGWAAMRAVFDQRFGPSQADNLAAYWDLPTVSIVLACNPNESDAGVLSMSYAPRTAL